MFWCIARAKSTRPTLRTVVSNADNDAMYECSTTRMHPFADDRSAKMSFSPGGSYHTNTSAGPSALCPLPTVTIMVESPQDPPSNDFPPMISVNPPSTSATSSGDEQRLPTTSTAAAAAAAGNVVIDMDTPIDVNVPRDTSNIFYDYSATSVEDVVAARSGRRTDSHTIDMTEADGANDVTKGNRSCNSSGSSSSS